ncbi:MAG: UvrD-helicase domain-containing protein, partial [Firmicutes bacterium]|nr:UvrD-helicase domain-containing protein [Bacillota bacterium]
MITAQDQAVRVQALQTTDRNVLVEAGAGTGKTTLLVQRALVALLDQQVPVEQLVLITFMEKAAAEIIERLETSLQAIVQQTNGDDLRRQRAEQALKKLSAAQITTIHGFCRSILQRYAISAQVPFNFRVLDGYQEEQLWEETFHA